jgi:hypothetical protein
LFEKNTFGKTAESCGDFLCVENAWEKEFCNSKYLSPLTTTCSTFGK